MRQFIDILLVNNFLGTNLKKKLSKEIFQKKTINKILT
jgi:hypothetical protein